MNPRPVDVKVQKDYKLIIVFNSGEEKIFDFRPYLQYRIYEPLYNYGLFSTAKADGMTVYWNDDLDICPDTLYEESVPMKTQGQV